MTAAVRFEDGPLAGETRFVPPETGWPLPDDFMLALISDVANFAIGSYVKSSESQLSDEAAEHPGIMRGALYQWHTIETDNGGEDHSADDQRGS